MSEQLPPTSDEARAGDQQQVPYGLRDEDTVGSAAAQPASLRCSSVMYGSTTVVAPSVLAIVTDWSNRWSSASYPICSEGAVRPSLSIVRRSIA